MVIPDFRQRRYTEGEQGRSVQRLIQQKLARTMRLSILFSLYIASSWEEAPCSRLLLSYSPNDFFQSSFVDFRRSNIEWTGLLLNA